MNDDALIFFRLTGALVLIAALLWLRTLALASGQCAKPESTVSFRALIVNQGLVKCMALVFLFMIAMTLFNLPELIEVWPG